MPATETIGVSRLRWGLKSEAVSIGKVMALAGMKRVEVLPGKDSGLWIIRARATLRQLAKFAAAEALIESQNQQE